MTDHPDPHKRLGQIIGRAREDFAQTGAGRALIRQRSDESLHLLTLALPYVEEAANDPSHKPGPVRDLARRIRAHIEGETP